MKKNTVLAKFNTVLAKFNTVPVLTKKNTAEFSVIFSYSVDSSLGRVPACNAARVRFPDDAVQSLAFGEKTDSCYLLYTFLLNVLKKGC